MNYRAITGILLCLLLLVSGVSATTWTYANGCWTATDGLYTLAMINTTGNSSISVPTGNVEYLVVGGAGSGAGSTGGGSGGGGGAGGFLNGTFTSITGVLHWVVGKGGAATTGLGNDGTNSSLTYDSGFINSDGGGGGFGPGSGAGRDGASGGGGNAAAGGLATGTPSTQGLPGGTSTTAYTGAGGGGKGSHGNSTSGNPCGDGGNGNVSYITGEPLPFSAGGAGSSYYVGNLPGVGGSAGGIKTGGDGKYNANGDPGVENTGSGGGGAGSASAYSGGKGADGIIILRYLTPETTPVASFAANVTGGQAPLPVYFTDTSTNRPKVWNWSVNASDWSTRTWYNYTTSTNLEYTFTTSGLYNVTLSVQNITESATISTAAMDILVNATLVADFVGAPVSGYASTDVSFVDYSTGAGIYSWAWTFGDGGTSTDRNPTHTYATDGIFDVSLTVIGADGTNVKTEVGYITMGVAPNPDAASALSFRQDDNIIRNLTYYNRTVQVSNIINASWINGTTLFDYEHISIRRILANTSTFQSNTISSYSINNATGVIMFNATNTSGFVAGTTPLSFMDIEMLYDRYSPGVTGAGWGTGLIGNSTYKVQFPAITLTDTPLMYSWTTFSNFTVNNTAPIILEQPVLFTPELNFTANRYLWDFGDGTTFLSHNTTATHMYTSASGDVDSGYGSYTISLTAYRSENTSVTNTTTRVGYITPVYNASYVQADFSATPTSGSVGLNVQFTDLSIWGTTAVGSGRTYNWSFGDDGYTSVPYSSSINPNHVYAALGTYTVKLTVNNTLANSTEMKTNYITIATSALTTWYTQRIVKISPVDSNGIPINNANVSMNFRGSSLPNTDVSWIQSAFGVSETVANQMQDSTYTMSSNSGEAGSVSFMVFPGFLYDVRIQNTTTGLNYQTSLHPSDPEYTIYCPTVSTILNKGNVTSTQIVNTSLYVTQPNMSYVTINFIYQDVSTLTTSVKWDVKLIDNNTVMYTKTFPNPGIGVVLDNYTVKNTRGEEWWFGYNATRSARS